MKVLFLFLCFAFTGNTFMAQIQRQDSVAISNNYAEKYKSKKQTANILLASGGILISAGLISFATDTGNNGFMLITQNQFIGALLLTAGMLTSIISIPFYISAGKNKRKSLSLQPIFYFDKSEYTQQKFANVGFVLTF